MFVSFVRAPLACRRRISIGVERHAEARTETANEIVRRRSSLLAVIREHRRLLRYGHALERLQLVVDKAAQHSTVVDASEGSSAKESISARFHWQTYARVLRAAQLLSRYGGGKREARERTRRTFLDQPRLTVPSIFS